MRQFFREMLIGISFYTRFPINLKDVGEDEFFHSELWMPIIGALIGLCVFAVAWLLHFVPYRAFAAILLMIFYLWITGGLHYDGVADTADAIFSARDHKKMMAIMKDSRLGSFGAIALVLMILTMVSGFQVLIYRVPVALFLMPIVGRYSAIQTCALSHYAEGGGGLGRAITEIAKPWHALVYFVIIFLVMLWLEPVVAVAFAVTSAINILLRVYFDRKIGGITGDTIGMTIELTQAIFVTAVVLLLPSQPMINVMRIFG